MSAAQTLPADEPADDEAKRLAERAETLKASDEAVARKKADLDEAIEHVRAIAGGEQPGNLHEWMRSLGERAATLKHEVQRGADFRFRFEREDAGEIEPPKGGVRKTEPANRVRAHELAHPLVSTFGINAPFGPDDERLDLLATVARVGTDLAPEQQRAETFERVRLAEGLTAATDVALVGERHEGRVVRMVLRGARLPAIAAPDDGDARTEELDRLGRDVEAEKLKEAPPPWPSCEWQGQARQAAWQAMLADERAHPANRGKPSWQVEREMARRLPAWARAVGMEVPRG